MEENENNTLPQETEDISKDSSGCLGCWCLVWPYLILSVVHNILLVIWLIQGIPDTWYGKIFRFQWKVGLGIIAALAAGTVLYGIIYILQKIVEKIFR